MFLKTTSSKGYKYLQIIQSYRDNGTVRHKVIANLGRADLLAENGLENIITALQKFVKTSPKENENKRLYDISKMKEKARVNYGYLAYKHLWKKFSLSDLLESFVKKRKVEFDFVNIVFSLVINRLLAPSSKHYYYRHRDKFIEYDEDLELHQIYRALDLLSDNKEEIEECLFQQNRNLFNMQVDVVFYDVTTYHFESQKADDQLLDFGFSKANKVNEVQVVMGLIIDKEGRPVGYELFPGNTFEGKTMLNLLEKLKKLFMLNQVIIVADKGLNSKINLKEIKDRGFDYILSAKIKNMSRKAQKEILSDEGYKSKITEPINSADTKKKEEIYRTKVLDYENNVEFEEEETKKKKRVVLKEKMVCIYSSKRARKDQRDRERAIEKANKILEQKDYGLLKQKKGYKKYIKSEKEATENKDEKYILDEKRIKEESRFDGYSAIEYSRLDLEPDEVIKQYYNLYRVEESFRILKSTMRTRPIYLRTPKHVSGHFAMCFFAFLLERDLEIRLRKRDIEFSPERIKEALNTMEFSHIQLEKESLFLKGKHNELASKIFSSLRINQPNNLLAENQVFDYMKV